MNLVKIVQSFKLSPFLRFCFEKFKKLCCLEQLVSEFGSLKGKFTLVLAVPFDYPIGPDGLNYQILSSSLITLENAHVQIKSKVP